MQLLEAQSFTVITAILDAGERGSPADRVRWWAIIIDIKSNGSHRRRRLCPSVPVFALLLYRGLWQWSSELFQSSTRS